jgi:hypothetical protein
MNDKNKALPHKGMEETAIYTFKTTLGEFVSVTQFKT